ncbi:MAG: acyl-CoA thioesterase [Alistipes sp.]|jgi:acyl-CoA thioester hydrolase|nr:acyl-CoA thioesterase [Alistipes sp.]
MKKVIETEVQVRFADVDVFGHVNNIHQQAYLDLGKTDFYRRVLGLDALADNPTLVIVSVRTDFLEQVRRGDVVVVRTWVERVGTKSVTLGQRIVVRRAEAEVVCTESESVLVCFDLRAQQSVEVPDRFRELLF